MSGRGDRCYGLRCNHMWISRVENPVMCPRCRQAKWNVRPNLSPKPRSGIPGVTWSRPNNCWQVHYSTVKRVKDGEGHRWVEVRERLGHYSTIYAAAKRLLEALDADGFPPCKKAQHYVSYKSERERDMYEKSVREAAGKTVIMD